MPSKVVEVPGVGNVEFPDSMSDADIGAAIQKSHPVEQSGAISRFFDPLNPKHLYDALTKPSADKNEDPRATFGKNFLTIVSNISDASKSHFEQSSAALDKGDFKSALGHAVYSIPVVGQILDDAMQKYQKGDIAGGNGSLTSLLGPKLLHDAAPAISGGIKAGASAVADTTKAAVRVAGNVAGSVPPDLVGIVSPRVAHILGVIQRLKKAIAPTSTDSGGAVEAPRPQIVPGEAPPAERPAWRQDVVSELNQDLPAAAAQPLAATLQPAAGEAQVPAAQLEPAYVPPNLNTPDKLAAAQNLKEALGGKTEPPVPQLGEPPGHWKEAVSRDKRALAIAQFLHAGGEGMGLDDATQLDPLKSKLDPAAIGKLWKQIDDAAAQQFGLKVNAKPPSMATQRQALDHLQRLWAPALSNNPAAFSAARKLQEAMGR